MLDPFAGMTAGPQKPSFPLSERQDRMFEERELSSLQQRMRNSRAQTAYTLQQEKGMDLTGRMFGEEGWSCFFEVFLCWTCLAVG